MQLRCYRYPKHALGSGVAKNETGMRLTDNGIKALKARAERYEAWEDGQTGFGLRVSPKGRKTWIFMYRFEGRARRLTLGAYPAIPLSKARIKFAAAKDALDHGRDPGAAAVAEKAAEREAMTVEELVKEYLARSAKSLRSYKEVKRILEREVVPAWGRRKVKAIKRRDFILLLDGIVDRGAPVMANRTRSWVTRMFNFAVGRDVIDVNPCSNVEAPGVEVERERTLTDDEIRGLWTGLDETDLPAATRFAIKLILVTAQRPSEAAGLLLPELDLEQKLWTLPPERTKNKRIHIVPLSPQALTLIKRATKECAHEDALFPGERKKEPITAGILDRAFMEHAEVLGIPVIKPPKDAPPGTRTRLGFTPHDLRRTASTRMTELGFTRFIVDRILNHTEPGVGRIYDRYEYLKEKRAALDAWGRRLDEILAGKKAAGDNVVTMRTA